MSFRSRLPLIVAASIAVSALLACSGSSGEAEQTLKLRASSFGDLLVELRELPDGRASDELAAFLEPGPERSSRVAAYLSESRASSGKYRVVASSVDEVRVSPDETEGLVVFSVRARGPEGTELAAKQRTHWLRVEGEWYRSSREAEKRLDG